MEPDKSAKLKLLEDELARLTAPKNGLYTNFKRVVHLHKLIEKGEL